MKLKLNNTWDRKLWAVVFRSKSCRPEGMIIGKAWNRIYNPSCNGEPTRCLLFLTRRQAKDWCVKKTEECNRHSKDWRFTPVRVREVVEVIQQGKGRGQNDRPGN